MKNLLLFFLLALLSTVNLSAETGEHPIFETIQMRQTSKALQMIKDDPTVVSIVRHGGETPLMTAAFKGDLKVCKALLAAGASPTAQDNTLLTALSYYIPGVRDNAKENVKMSSFLIPLLIEKNQIDSWSKGYLLKQAVEKGLCKAIRLFFKAGFHTAWKDVTKDTLLDIAIIKNQPQAAGLLVKLGADVNKRSSHSSITPLMNAAYYDHPEVVLVLLKAGADSQAGLTQEVGFPIDPEKDWSPFVMLPAGSTALDIARCLKKLKAQAALENQ